MPGEGPVKRRGLFCILVVSLSLVACSATRVASVWRDEAYPAGAVKKIMVTGSARNPSGRVLLENGFVMSLRHRGIEAVPAHMLLAPEQYIPDAVFAKAREQRFDAVLMTSLADEKTIEKFYPPYPGGRSYLASPWDYSGWEGRYFQGQPGTVRPTSSVDCTTYKIISFKTDLYDVKTGRVVWSVLLDTVVKDRSDGGMSSFIGAVTERLEADRLIS